MGFSETLKDLRLSKNMSQKQLAEMLGTTNSSICDWERGRTEPDKTFVLKLADCLNVSTDYLLGRTDEMGTVVMSGHAPQLSTDEREVLSLYASLSPTRKEDLKIYLRALSGAGAISEKKKA